MLVIKFGGTSVGSGERIAAVARIIQKEKSEQCPTESTPLRLVVVSSAMSGVTDSLIQAARSAAAGDLDTMGNIKQNLLTRHRAAIAEAVQDEQEQQALYGEIDRMLNDLEQFCRSIAVLGELTPRALDLVVSLGERMAVRILAATLRSMQLPAEAVDANHCIVTDDVFGSAAPLRDLTRVRTHKVLQPLLDRGILPIVTGFIGATQSGIITTLGRGGSDYSAAILGDALDATAVTIWTDVDGVMTADPRIIPEARTLPLISYEELAELSYFGAKVVHPKTILPVIERHIPLHIKNTFNPSHPGTLVINAEYSAAGAVTQPESPQYKRYAAANLGVKSVTFIDKLSLLTVAGRGMLGVPGVTAKVFTTVAHETVSILMISQCSSEQSICFVIERAASSRTHQALKKEFELEIMRHMLDRITTQDDVGIVSVVGAGMRDTPGIAGKIFGALARHHINAISIAQGSSEYNLTIVLQERDLQAAVRHIHAEFGLGDAEPSELPLPNGYSAPRRSSTHRPQTA